jgi:fatty acid desaturase
MLMSSTADSQTAHPVAKSEPIARVEAPTLLLAFGIYGGWLALTMAYGHWPLAIVAPALVLLLVLHGSLQHEILHGHPTRNVRLNRTLAMLPLSLWLPYERYRATHLQHHQDERLTDPLDDPESYYWTPERWQAMSPISRVALRLQQTLAGRVLIGSFWGPGMFLATEWRALVRNEPGLRAIWIEHLLWAVPMLLWVKLVCGMPLWIYVVVLAIPANGILLIRSFAEHRALTAQRHRVAIVERSWFFGPLFLFNNLHALHHESPMLPWYRYHQRYRRERARLIAENGGLVYVSYFEVARRYLFRAHDAPVHPTGRVPQAQAGTG